MPRAESENAAALCADLSPSMAHFFRGALKKPRFFANKSWSDPIRIV